MSTDIKKAGRFVVRRVGEVQRAVESQNRRELVREAVKLMGEWASAEWRGVISDVVLDDYGLDNRDFWVHFRAPGLNGVRQPNSSAMKEARAAHLGLSGRAAKWLKGECGDIHDIYWSTRVYPVMRYHTVFGERVFDGYDTDTWVKTISFYG